VVNPFHIGQAIETLQAEAAALSAAHPAVTVGGDHTIALPLLRAASAQHGPVALLHFDAHLDTWDTYFGEPYTHGTPFRRAVEEGILDTSALCTSVPGGRSTAARPRRGPPSRLRHRDLGGRAAPGRRGDGGRTAPADR